MNNFLGAKIKSLREEADLTQEEFAAKLGVKRGTLASWEVGRSVPGYVDMISISQIFSVSVDWMLGIKSTNPVDAEILQKLRRLNPDQKNLLIGLLDNMITIKSPR